MLRRIPLVLTTVAWLAGCRDEPKQAADPPDEQGPAPPAEPEPDPWQRTLDGRVLADSGIDVGGKLMSFDIINVETGERYCQICRFGSDPKIMAVGTPDDEAFHEDLKDLDAIVTKYGRDRLEVFAVLTELDQGKATIPEDVEAAVDESKTLRTELGLQMPVVVPAPARDEPPVWEQYYNIRRSRTIMFADRKNDVRYSAIAPEHFADLDGAIREVLDGSRARSPQGM